MTNMINALPFLKRVCKYQDFKSNIQQGFKNIFEGVKARREALARGAFV